MKRKLTKKSIFGFGRYADCSVRQVLDLVDKQYIQWVYYNSSNIDFFEDILEEVGITESLRIEKPGVARELFEEIKQFKCWRYPRALNEHESKMVLARAANRKRTQRLRSERALNHNLSRLGNKNRNQNFK